MRFGLVLQTAGERPLSDLVAQARAAEDAGFDLVWVEEDHGDPGATGYGDSGATGYGLPDALAVASAIAPHTTSVRVVACCRAGLLHPVYLAEQSAVADLVLGGRLVLGLRSAPGTEALLGEVADAVVGAHASVPVRREGGRWPMPAGLAGNRFGVTSEVAVTPTPAQLELPVWLAGDAAAATDVAATRALSMVGEDGEDAAAMAGRWRAVEGSLGPAAVRLRRVARRAVPVSADGSPDLHGLLLRLHEDQRAWRMDTAVLVRPAGLGIAGVADLVVGVAQRVRPHLALAALPPGLAEHWEATDYGAGTAPGASTPPRTAPVHGSPTRPAAGGTTSTTRNETTRNGSSDA